MLINLQFIVFCTNYVFINKQKNHRSVLSDTIVRIILKQNKCDLEEIKNISFDQI